MKNLFLIVGFILLFFMPLAAESQSSCTKTNEGKDFWFAFMEGRSQESDHYVEVTLTSAESCNYEIWIGKSNTFFKSGTVNANSFEQIRIDWKLVEAIGSEEIQTKAIHLTSDHPMNVFAYNYCSNSADATLIFPTGALGTEYYAMCYEPNVDEYDNGNYRDGRNSEFLIVATEDNTLVTITLSKVTDKKAPANVPFVIVMNRGEVYQVQSMNRKNLAGQGDLTGSYIKSDKLVALFSGSLATTVPYGTEVKAWDHLFEQMPPLQAWGKKFMTVPLKSREHDIYRILAAYDNTTVKMGSTNWNLPKKGDFHEFTLGSEDPRIIESSKPALLVQYSCSNSEDTTFTHGTGDPFMVVVNPLVQTKQNVTFVAYKLFQITDGYFVNVTAKDDATSFITLDGKPVNFTSLPNSGYSYAQVPVSQGNHTLKSSQAGKGFNASVYGFGAQESYGYNIGFNISVQLDLGYKYLKNDSLQICGGIEVKLDAGAFFDNYKWEPTGETTPVIMASRQGKYKITVSTNEGCELSDSVYIKVIGHKIDLGNDTVTCGHGELVLDAGKGFASYKWQDGSDKQTFAVYKTGDYFVTGSNDVDCQSTDTVHIEVLSPIVSFTPNFSLVVIDHPDISFTNQTEGAVGFLWDFGDGSTSKETNPTHHYSTSGKYHVVLQAVSKYNCSDSIGVDVRVVPVALFIPNAFRPESEIPENRIFRPILVGVDPNKYKFEVFNRVGSAVFETSNSDSGWDGNLPGGTNAGPGVYVWVCKYSDLQGFESVKKGTVMLVR